MRARSAPLVLLLLGAAAVFASCANDFDPASKLASVRILATRADEPYAKPGDKVNLQVLAYDGRSDKSRPMTIYWIPIVCEDPKNDAYYACFAPPAAEDAGADAGALAGGGDAGASANLGALLRSGVDLTPFLPTGDSFSFTMPADAIDKHPPTPGAPDPYGLAIVFNVACAGHLEAVPLAPGGGPQQVPLGCFDENENQLAPSEYVIGFTRVYAYASRTNANPVIHQALFQGNPVDPTGVHVDRCTTDPCPELTFDVDVPESSWEENPGDVDPAGRLRHEEIWVDYYSSIGTLEENARLLYDAVAGKSSNSQVKFQGPGATGDGKLWAVVHDNRGGVAWVEIDVHVR
jgi:hypothetical protein